MPATNYDYDARIDITGFDKERVFSEPIQLLDRTDAPLLEIIGGLNGAGNWGFNGTPGTKVEWLQDEHNVLTGTFTEPDAVGTNAVVALTVDDATKIEERSVLRIDASGELVWVSAVNKTTNVITVTRGWGDGGIAAAAFADNATWTLVGIAKLEGDEYHMGFGNLPWGEYNYSQIFQRSFGMSGTAKEVPNQVVGIKDLWGREKIKALRDVMTAIDKALTFGVRSNNIGTAALPRTFGGYPYFIKTNVQNAATFTLDQLNAMITQVYDYGATDPVVIASPLQYKLIKTFLTTTGSIVNSNIVIPYNTTRLGMQVTEIDADFGTLRIVKNIKQPNHIMPIFNLPDIGMLTIRPLKVEDMPKTADRYEQSVLGEFTFCLRNEKRFAMFTGLSLT